MTQCRSQEKQAIETDQGDNSCLIGIEIRKKQLEKHPTAFLFRIFPPDFDINLQIKI